MVEKVAGGERPDYKSGRSEVQSLFRLPFASPQAKRVSGMWIFGVLLSCFIAELRTHYSELGNRGRSSAG